jgi:hypothetical protein
MLAVKVASGPEAPARLFSGPVKMDENTRSIPSIMAAQGWIAPFCVDLRIMMYPP